MKQQKHHTVNKKETEEPEEEKGEINMCRKEKTEKSKQE